MLYDAPGLLWTPMKKLLARARHKRFMDFQATKAAASASSRCVTQNPPSSGDLGHVLDISSAYLNINTGCFPSMSNPRNSLSQQQQWTTQPELPTSEPMPWLLGENAMQELGLDMTGFDPNMDMDWSNWAQMIQPGNYESVPEGWGQVFENPVTDSALE